MRTPELFHWIAKCSLDLAKIGYFCSDNFRGGWEPWLQCELAAQLTTALLKEKINLRVEREKAYPNSTDNAYLSYNADLNPQVTEVTNITHASRADLFFERSYQGQSTGSTDSTYIELKCMLAPGMQHSMTTAFDRLTEDSWKVWALGKTNKSLSCIALLAVFGNISADYKKSLISKNYGSLLVLDYETKLTTKLSDMRPDNRPNLYLVGWPDINLSVR